MEESLFALGLPPNLKRDPEGVTWALEWFGRDDHRDLRAGLGGQLAAALAKDDPARAMTWAATHLSGASMARAMAAVVASQMRQDQEAAIAAVDALPPGGVRRQAGRALVMAMMREDPAGAVERALGDQRMEIDIGRSNWSRLGAAVGSKEPDLARQLLADPPEGLSAVFEQQALDAIGRRDPGATLEWAAKLGDDRGTQITKRVLGAWRARDPMAARKWQRQGSE
jgi:hypothetical protein